MGAEYCDERVSLYVCLRVCLSEIISSELHVRSSPNFLCMLPMAVARSSSGGVMIQYVFPYFCFVDDVICAHKLRLLDVAARLR